MNRLLPIVIYIIVFLFVILPQSHEVFCAEYHGLISMDDYYSNESGSSYDYHLLTTRIRLDADKLNKAGSLSLHFEGRERNNLGDQDYYSSTSNSRIDTLNIEYNRKKTDIVAGRLWPKELYTERVDGLNILRHGPDSGIGVFAGIKPDPYTQEFNSNYTAAGVYYYRHKKSNSENLAFIHNGFKGKTDRQYMYGQASYYPTEKISLYGTITADIDQISGGLDLTNAIVEISWRPDYRKGFAIGYSNFHAFRLYESMDIAIDTGTQNSYYMRGDYRLSDKYSIYGRYDLQTLNYNSLDAELRTSNTVQIGVRNDNLLNSQISMDFNTTIADSFGSGYGTYELQFSRFFKDTLQLTLHSAYTQSTSDIIDYSDNIFVYDLSVYYSFSRMWTASVSYQGRSAKDYETENISTRVTYRF
ncbi:MAG: hypothetical protein IT393_05370 [Nitrospirae bacterium]|nr:hypothetical protein [Nitrospirota bacterium]